MPFVNVIQGESLPTSVVNVRTPIVHIPLGLAIVWSVVRGCFRLVWWAVRHIRLVTTITAVCWLYLHLGGVGLGLLAAGIAAGVGWFFWHRPSFNTLVGWPVLARWQRQLYARKWNAAMANTGLAVTWDRHTVLPELVRVRCTAAGDVLTVRMVTGQVPDDWAKASLRLAHTFKAQGCRVTAHPRRPELVVLTLRRRDQLTVTVPPIPPTPPPDLSALPAGRTEDGKQLMLRLSGTHILIVGATGSGKGSGIWSILAALAGGIKAGTVRVWAFDPKGGMELALGMPLFDRFLCDAFEAMADALDDAVTILQTRARRLRGVTRQHAATPEDPTYVLVVDELAALIAYVQDRKLKDRIRNALNLILSQGRAVGVHVVAAAQDPRKETLTVRDLFPTRIGLRMIEDGHVDLALNDGARDRGAYCDLIPQHGAAGTAYIVLEGDPVPQRIRFSYWTDADIRALARDYGTLRPVPAVKAVA